MKSRGRESSIRNSVSCSLFCAEILKFGVASFVVIISGAVGVLLRKPFPVPMNASTVFYWAVCLHLCEYGAGFVVMLSTIFLYSIVSFALSLCLF